MDSKEVLLQQFIIFFDKTSAGSGVKSEIVPNQELAEELHKPIIRKCEKWKVYSSFKDNIWVADLPDMQLINRFSKGYCFLLRVIVIYGKYAWVVPLNEKEYYNY